MKYNIVFVVFILFITKRALVAKSDSCLDDASFDVVLALDNTGSMQASQQYVKEQVPQLFTKFQQDYPGSRFGFVTFNDEPAGRVPENYCAKIECRLATSVSKLEKACAEYVPLYGDYFRPEDAMGAILLAASNSGMGWRKKKSKHYYRVIVIITDSKFRRPKDTPARVNPLTSDLKPNNGDGDYQCGYEDYPTTDQAKQALVDNSVIPLFLILDDDLKLNYIKTYEDVIEEWGFGGAVGQKDASRLFNIVTDTIERVVCETETSTLVPESTAAVVPAKSIAPIAIGAAVGGILLLAGAAGLTYALATPSTVAPVDGEFDEIEVEEKEAVREIYATLNEGEFS